MQVLILRSGQTKFIGNLFQHAVPPKRQWTQTDAIFFEEATKHLEWVESHGLLDLIESVRGGLLNDKQSPSSCDPIPGTDAYSTESMREASLNFIYDQVYERYVDFTI
jgi:hypothetical protein